MRNITSNTWKIVSQLFPSRSTGHALCRAAVCGISLVTCSAFAQSTPAPIINSVYPNAVTPTAPAAYMDEREYNPYNTYPPPSGPPDPVVAQIAVKGSGFGSNPSTNFGTVTAPKADGTGFTLQLYPKDVARPGVQNLQVTNAGKVSHAMPIVVTNPFPSSFLPPISLSTSLAAQAVAVADLNNDQCPDLAVAQPGGVLIFLGSKSGTFTRQTNFPYAGSNPVALVTADLNGDGNRDLIVADSGTHKIYSYLGDGSGHFPRYFSQLTNHHLQTMTPSGLAVGDFNADGKPDVLVNYSDGPGSDELYGDGTGVLKFANGGMVSGYAASGVNKAFAVGDFDGDGYLDFAVSSPSDNSIYIFPSSQKTSPSGQDEDFSYGQQIQLQSTLGALPSALVAADFTGDGILDLAVASQVANTNNVCIYTGNGKATFSQSSCFNVGNIPVSLAAADFDGDGELDLAVATQGSSSDVRIFSGHQGSFSLSSTIGQQVPPSSLAAADCNADGRVDLVSVGFYGTAMMLQAAAPQILLPALFEFPDGVWTRQATLTIQNAGTAELNITSISLNSAFESNSWELVSGSNCLTSGVDPGNSCTAVYNSKTPQPAVRAARAATATQTVIVPKPFQEDGKFTIQYKFGSGTLTQQVKIVYCNICWIAY